MEQYDNELQQTQEQQAPVTESPASSPAPQPQAEPMQGGYYHGVGAGQREAFGGSTCQQPSYQQPSQQSYYQQPAAKQPWQNYYQPAYQYPPQSSAAPARPKKKNAFWKGLVSALLIVVLVVCSCGATVLCVDHLWQEKYDLLRQNTDEKIQALQDQINQSAGALGGIVSGGELAVPGENLTATQIYQQNVRSVVAVSATIRTITAQGAYESSSAGTGFVLTADGYIVTNHHVIEGASSIAVTMYDSKTYTAALIGSDATNDIALLKVEGKDLDPVTLGSSASVQVGDQVVAIGNALGELSSSLTVGYISGIDRDVATDGSVMAMLQTDAAINSGNSGGPLFNARGEVIGINTAKYSGTTTSGASIEGIGFAIPIDDVSGMLQDLMEYGYIRSAYLGIYCKEVSETALYYGVPRGVYVDEAVEGYCAKAAGVREGDIIIGLGGYEVESMNDLSKALRAYEAGETVSITLWRSGKEIILSVTLDEKPQG